MDSVQIGQSLFGLSQNLKPIFIFDIKFIEQYIPHFVSLLFLLSFK